MAYDTRTDTRKRSAGSMSNLQAYITTDSRGRQLKDYLEGTSQSNAARSITLDRPITFDVDVIPGGTIDKLTEILNEHEQVYVGLHSFCRGDL
mgnify:CR=1 FL=1